MPGKRLKTIAANRRKAYEAMKGTMPKTMAARIANAGKTKAGRSAMARKAARTRRAR